MPAAEAPAPRSGTPRSALQIGTPLLTHCQQQGQRRKELSGARHRKETSEACEGGVSLEGDVHGPVAI